MRQSVHEKQRDMIDILAKLAAVAIGDGSKRANGFPRRHRIEILDIVETMRNEMKARAGKADETEAVLIVTDLGQFARTCAPDHRHAFAVDIDSPCQCAAIITVRAEDQHARERLAADLAHDLIHRRERIPGMA